MYDTSPESWAHGAVDRLLFITRALSYFEHKAKRKHGSGAEFPSLEKLCHLLFPLCSILCQFASTNLYASLSFCECRQCLSNWEVQTCQMTPCQNRRDCVVLLKLVSFQFKHSSLRYCPKHEGNPCMGKELK